MLAKPCKTVYYDNLIIDKFVYHDYYDNLIIDKFDYHDYYDNLIIDKFYYHGYYDNLFIDKFYYPDYYDNLIIDKFDYHDYYGNLIIDKFDYHDYYYYYDNLIRTWSGDINGGFFKAKAVVRGARVDAQIRLVIINMNFYDYDQNSYDDDLNNPIILMMIMASRRTGQKY